MIEPSAPVASTPVERAMALATIGNEMLPAFLAKRVGPEPEWLTAAVSIGVFDLARDSESSPERQCFQDVYGAVNAVTALTGDVARNPSRSDPLYGEMWGGAGDHYILSYVPTAEQQSAFRALVDQVTESQARLQVGVSTQSPGSGSELMLKSIYGRLMVCACVLDVPDSLDALLQVRPECALTPLRIDSAEHLLQVASERLSAYGYALMLSRTDCMRCIEVALPNAPLVVSGRVGAEPPPHLTALELPIHLNGLECHPSAYAQAVSAAIARGGDAKPLIAAAEKLLFDPVHREPGAHMLPAFLHAGLFDVNPGTSFDNACRGAQVHVLEHFKGRVPWETSAFTTSAGKSPLMEALDAFGQVDGHPDQEESIERVIDMAILDGKQDLVFRLHGEPITPTGGGPRIFTYPIEHLFHFEFVGSLVRLLDNGLDLEAPGVPGGLSPLEIADQEFSTRESNGAVEVFRSYRARTAVAGLLSNVVQKAAAP